MLIRQFEQHKDPRLPGGAGKGVCLVMSCWYLINAAKGTDYWDWFSETAPIVREQGQRTVAPEHYFPQMLTSGNLSLRGRINTATAYLPDALLDNRTPRGGVWPFRLAVMDAPEWNMAHAIALYWGMKIRVLDVTEGEFEFDTADDCRRWLGQHNQLPRVKFASAEVPYSTAFPKLTVFGFEKSGV